jgi:hypothetical protein
VIKKPDYYPQYDTFKWAEDRFDKEVCLAIASFNIHKYNDRAKGQDYDDFGKIIAYATWARKIMEEVSE